MFAYLNPYHIERYDNICGEASLAPLDLHKQQESTREVVVVWPSSRKTSIQHLTYLKCSPSKEDKRYKYLYERHTYNIRVILHKSAILVRADSPH